MNVWNGIERYPAERNPVVATIGNYDGVHLGHQSILDQVTADASRRGLTSLLITFDPHPLAVVAPTRKPSLLQTRRQKLLCLEASGLSDVLIIDFDAELAALTGERFFAELLDPVVEFSAIHVGESFRFGRDRSAGHEELAAIARERGFESHRVAPIRDGDEPVSSSRIRRAVAAGRVADAAKMLGRPFALEGTVVRGQGRGKSLQFPTANLRPQNEQLPGAGVYVTEALFGASRQPAVTNVGIRPTFGGDGVVVETHLIEFEGDLYEERLEVRFLDRIRDEMTFDGPAELADQIARDRAAAESYFQNLLL